MSPLASLVTHDGGESENPMEITAKAGIPLAVGLQIPSTPIEPAPISMAISPGFDPSSASGSLPSTLSTHGVHGREGTEDVDEANRPPKQARIMAVFEHEDDIHPLHFEDADVDSLELYDYECDEEDEGASTNVASDDIIKRLCVPYSTFELELEPSKLLELDLLADELEIGRLKAMGVFDPG